jgi:hypothetical protein
LRLKTSNMWKLRGTSPSKPGYLPTLSKS